MKTDDIGVRSSRNVPSHSARVPVSGLHLRRRRVVVGLSGAIALCLVLGALPALGAFWTIAIVFVVALATYMVLLARFAGVGSSTGHRRRTWEGGEFNAPEEWVSPQFDGAVAVHDRDPARLPWVRLLAEERSA
jgi:hypothetical protein